MALTILSFLFLASLIFFSGKRLSVYGDIIAEHLGLGKAWIGLILMASVTSLPELTVGISSAAIVGSADLAVGDIMGSCVFNLFILSLLDAFTPHEPLLSKVSQSHTLAGAMSIILVAFVGFGLFLPQEVIIIRWIGLSSLFFILIYFVSMRIIYQYEVKIRVQKEGTSGLLLVPQISLRKAAILYAVNAAVVMGAALFLPALAEKIAHETGLGASFTGTLFLAASTSLPEIAVSFAALRMGSLDLAVGNLIGSNLFNILILAIDDTFYTKGYLLKDASDVNLYSVFSLIIMTAIAIAGLTYRISKKQFFLAWDALLIGVMYIINLCLLYYLRT